MTEKKLTPQQEHFCQLVASGKTQADAYRGAYKVNPKTKPECVIVQASKLMSDPNITLRVAELKKELAEKELWTREQSLKALIDCLPTEVDQEGSIKAKSTAEIVAVIKELNAMQGFNAAVKTENKNTTTVKVEMPTIKKDGKDVIFKIG